MNRPGLQNAAAKQRNQRARAMNSRFSRLRASKLQGRGRCLSAGDRPLWLVGASANTQRVVFAERLIPARSTTDFERGLHEHLQASEGAAGVNFNAKQEASNSAFQAMLHDQLGYGKKNKTILLGFSVKPEQSLLDPRLSRENYVEGSYDPTLNAVKRRVPTKPERVLDAPDLLAFPDFQPLDWSSKNHVAVSLTKTVYTWNSDTRTTTCLADVRDERNVSLAITAISWNADGTQLAAGTDDGDIRIYDFETKSLIRHMDGFSDDIQSMAWNENIISYGNATGAIRKSDPRCPQHDVDSNLKAHIGYVCGLQWSPDFRYLATGGSDRTVKIWSAESGLNSAKPVSVFEHKWPVKAMAWCPWRPSLIATAGLSRNANSDGNIIRIWNASFGNMQKEVDAKASISSLIWSDEYKELIAAHRKEDMCELSIWNTRSVLQKVTDLQDDNGGPTLHMAMSPDGTSVVTADEEESLRFWKCFAVDPKKKENQRKLLGKTEKRSCLEINIR